MVHWGMKEGEELMSLSLLGERDEAGECSDKSNTKDGTKTLVEPIYKNKSSNGILIT